MGAHDDPVLERWESRRDRLIAAVVVVTFLAATAVVAVAAGTTGPPLVLVGTFLPCALLVWAGGVRNGMALHERTVRSRAGVGVVRVPLRDVDGVSVTRLGLVLRRVDAGPVLVLGGARPSPFVDEAPVLARLEGAAARVRGAVADARGVDEASLRVDGAAAEELADQAWRRTVLRLLVPAALSLGGVGVGALAAAATS